MHEFSGTIYFMAPEVFAKSYNEKCDIWSIGCIMFMILAVAYPFQSDDPNEVRELIQSGIFNKKKSGYKRLSLDAKSLIKSMLWVDPE